MNYNWLRNIAKMRILSSYYFFYSGNQSVLSGFWPFFRIFFPLVTGYLAFGQILEQNTGSIPYKDWVLTGSGVWLILGFSSTTGVTTLNTRNRRKKYSTLNTSNYNLLLAQVIPNFTLGALFLFYCFVENVKTNSLQVNLIKFLCLLIFLLVILQISIAACLLVGLFNALSRDTKVIASFASQFILYVSPIFYVQREPNSFIENLISTINPLTPFLDFVRFLIFDKPIILTISNYLLILFIFLLTSYLIVNRNRLISKIVWILDSRNERLDEE